MNTMNLLPTERDAVGEIRALVDSFTEGWEKLDSDQVLSTIVRRDDIVVFGTDEVEHWVGFDALVEPFGGHGQGNGSTALRMAAG